jgi:nucleoside-diphosphate-sugar epimerase
MSDGAILVTSIGGLIGGAVAHRLKDDGRDVVRADRDVPPHAPYR